MISNLKRHRNLVNNILGIMNRECDVKSVWGNYGGLDHFHVAYDLSVKFDPSYGNFRTITSFSLCLDVNDNFIVREGSDNNVYFGIDLTKSDIYYDNTREDPLVSDIYEAIYKNSNFVKDNSDLISLFSYSFGYGLVGQEMRHIKDSDFYKDKMTKVINSLNQEHSVDVKLADNIWPKLGDRTIYPLAYIDFSKGEFVYYHVKSNKSSSGRKRVLLSDNEYLERSIRWIRFSGNSDWLKVKFPKVQGVEYIDFYNNSKSW